MACLCVSQQGEFKNTTKIHVQQIVLPKKLREKKHVLLFSVVPPLLFFLIAFLAVSLHEELKNKQKMFSKIGPKNLKQISKKGR
jgi:hypothetical protein